MTTDRRPLVNASVEVDETDGRMTAEKALIDLGGATLGTGLPISAAPADPGNDAYAASGLALTRACTRVRYLVGDSGFILSLDGGVTDHLRAPPNSMDDVGISMPAAADVRVRRYTAGTAWTDLVLEVR